MAKRIKVSRKHLLKDPDQFLSISEKAMLYYMDNRATVIGVIVTLLIVLSSFFGFKYYQETQALGNEAFYFEMEKMVQNSKGNPSVAGVRSIWEKIGEGFQKERASLLLAVRWELTALCTRGCNESSSASRLRMTLGNCSFRTCLLTSSACANSSGVTASSALVSMVPGHERARIKGHYVTLLGV